MVFDVESIGLHGEGYAVGYVVIRGGKEVDSNCNACLPSSINSDYHQQDMDWVEKNIPPISADHMNASQVREAFWQRWDFWKRRGALLAADCAWPVEAGFLRDCIANDLDRRWDGPYPLLEVSTMLLAAGMDPLGTHERNPNELPMHHPVNDARQSARLLMKAIEILKRRSNDQEI